MRSFGIWRQIDPEGAASQPSIGHDQGKSEAPLERREGGGAKTERGRGKERERVRGKEVRGTMRGKRKRERETDRERQREK